MKFFCIIFNFMNEWINEYTHNEFVCRTSTVNQFRWCVSFLTFVDNLLKIGQIDARLLTIDAPQFSNEKKKKENHWYMAFAWWLIYFRYIRLKSSIVPLTILLFLIRLHRKFHSSTTLQFFGFISFTRSFIHSLNSISIHQSISVFSLSIVSNSSFSSFLQQAISNAQQTQDWKKCTKTIEW